MGEGTARRGSGGRHPRPCPGTRQVHTPRWTLGTYASSEVGREVGRALARRHRTVQNIWKKRLRISGTHSSEARIRQLLDLAKLSPDAERDFCEGRIGVKRALKLVRESRAIDQRQRLISADPASRQELIERGASLIVRWILRLLPEVYALQFLGIVKGEEFGPVGEVFLKLTPKPCTIRLSANPA